MKKIIVLAVIGVASQTIAAFAGPEPKQVVAPPPPPPPEYFRPNEFDIGIFATWAKFTGSNLPNGGAHGWGGGLDLTYWFPWKYAGVRFQGTGLDFSGGGDHRTETVVVPGFRPVTVSGGGGSLPAGQGHEADAAGRELEDTPRLHGGEGQAVSHERRRHYAHMRGIHTRRQQAEGESTDGPRCLVGPGVCSAGLASQGHGHPGPEPPWKALHPDRGGATHGEGAGDPTPPAP